MQMSHSFASAPFTFGGFALRRVATATVVRQKSNEVIHRIEVGGVCDRAAVLRSIDQTGVREFLEMERQRCARHFELLAQFARQHSDRTRFHKCAEDCEASGLSERGEFFGGIS